MRTHQRFRHLLLWLLLFTLAPATSLAANLPENGMTMTDVKTHFGAPDTTLPAVGFPPITRWVYPTYTVYFEYNLALDAVYHHKSNTGKTITETQPSASPNTTPVETLPASTPVNDKTHRGFHYDAASGRVVPAS